MAQARPPKTFGARQKTSRRHAQRAAASVWRQSSRRLGAAGAVGLHVKKLIKYRERNEGPRWLFRRELAKLNGQPLSYLDAGGVDHRLYRESGRAPRGERIYQAVAGQWRERPRIIAASQHGKLGAPLVFPGRCHTEVVDASFEPGLLPELPPGRGIVRDNARFHQSPTTQRLVEAAGGPWLFLPASSPDLNPLEHLWAAFKTRLRKDLPAAATPFLLIANISQCYC